MKKNFNKLILLSYILLFPVISLAQGGININQSGGLDINNGSNAGKIVNPLGTTTTIPGLIHTILTGALKIGIPIVALAIIYCGFLFVFARGNPEKLTKAKEALLYTLIGAAILLGSWAIAEMISATVTGLGS